MTTFDDREKRFEAEFAHNQELRFKVEMRRNRLVAAWAAELLGLEGDEAEEYGRSVVRSDLAEPGDEDVFRKLRQDLDGARQKVSDEAIREKMSECLELAMEQARKP